MISFPELNLKPSYHKGKDDIAEDFYLPCLRNALTYDRAVGFFSSAIYILAWSALSDFIENGGRIRVICSPILAAHDIDALKNGYNQKAEAQNSELTKDNVLGMLNDPLLRKSTLILAGLVANDILRLKIAFLNENASISLIKLFHDKVGILSDKNDNYVVFKGSMNETWIGLSNDGNLESIDVYASWAEEREKYRVQEEKAYFNELWENNHPSCVIREFPDVARDLLKEAAKQAPYQEVLKEVLEEISRQPPAASSKKRTPRPHQSQALDNWHKQGRRGVLEHATGSGKTFTALCAIKESFEKDEVPLILVPSEDLLKQWNEEIREEFSDFEHSILLAGGGHTDWREQKLLRPWSSPASRTRGRIILSTMQTAISPIFLSSIRQGEHLFMVADEVHRIGSKEHLKILQVETGPRLGLSATPRRAGDPVGTGKIFSYFNGVIQPPFTLFDAIKSKALTPYFYYVHQVPLSHAEQDEWLRQTKQIRQLYARQSKKGESSSWLPERIKHLLIERSRIVKSASGKVNLCLNVVLERFQNGQKWIVYCDDQSQMMQVQSTLSSQGFNAFVYFADMTGDRDRTLAVFEANGGIVVAIKCLDEGVDIPSVTHALILASSQNPREFIQRRGRVLRRAPNKALAEIHDVIVLPLLGDDQSDEVLPPGIQILEAELVRAIEFGKNAENPSAITDLERIALKFGLSPSELNTEGYEHDE